MPTSATPTALKRITSALSLALLGLTTASASKTPTIANHFTDINSWCLYLSKHLRSVDYKLCVARPWQGSQLSTQNRVIPTLSLDLTQTKLAKPTYQKIIILGALHGDEISSVSTVFRWLDYIEKNKSKPNVIGRNYLFIPLVNPDGFSVTPRTRTNSRGVDLNRNFDTKEWSKNALTYWRTKAKSDKRRYPGEQAASEKETVFVQNIIADFKPDLIVSVHAPYCLVDRDGPIEFPKQKSPLPVTYLGAFPGSLGTYAGLERHIPVVTPELPNATQLPKLQEVEQLFEFILNSK